MTRRLKKPSDSWGPCFKGINRSISRFDFWDGTVCGPEQGRKARFTMVLNHPGALRKMFLRPNQLTLGEAFIHNDYDIEGDIVDAFAFGGLPHGTANGA